VAATLRHLHRSKVVHLDLRCSNVLLDGRLDTAKVADLGKSGILQASVATERGTSNRYSPPEQLAGAWCGPESDVYSLGLIMREVLTGATARGRDARAELPLRCAGAAGGGGGGGGGSCR
jgi:serine/threonine-protein kinase